MAGFLRVDIETPRGWEEVNVDNALVLSKMRRWIHNGSEPKLAAQLNIVILDNLKMYMLSCSRSGFPPSEDDLQLSINNFLGTEHSKGELIIIRAEDRKEISFCSNTVSQVLKYISGSREKFASARALLI